MAESTETNPLGVIRELATGYWVPRCLHVVAEVGIADLLSDTPEPAEVLARKIDVHPGALARILRLLASYGVFEETGDGLFAHTAASRLLRSDHPQSQRSFARMMGMSVHWAAYGELEYSLRTGKSAMTKVTGSSTFEYFASHAEQARIFDEAMTGKSQAQIDVVLRAYDFSGFKRIADVGGGRGHLLEAVLRCAPGASGVVFDLPYVVTGLTPPTDLASRLQMQAGDFFKDPLPACDAYLLMSVIHDWSDAEAVSILKAVRRAAPSHAKLLLIELLVSEEPGPHVGKALDIEMLVMTTGQERTRAQYEQLLRAAGFRLEQVVPTAGATAILQGAAL
jgi:O-methyltransferase domain